MKSVEIQNLDRTLASSLTVKACDSFSSRLQGLMFRKHVPPHTGILLIQTTDSRIDSSIHMFFVFTDLAVIWMDSTKTVVDTILARSWRPLYIPHTPAKYILETHPDRLHEFHVGDKISFLHE